MNKIRHYNNQAKWRLCIPAANLVGFGGDGLSVGDNGVGFLERNAGVIFFQILQANLQVKLAWTRTKGQKGE